MLKYSDTDYVLIKDKNTIFVKNKKSSQYFQVDAKKIEECNEINWEPYKSKLTQSKMIFFLLSFSILYTGNFIIMLSNETDFSGNIVHFFIAMFLYLVIFIFIHELGHISFYKNFGGTINKVGFKFNYVFPSFYVRMNDTYLFSKYEKILVHSGGLLFSLVLNDGLYLISKLYNIDLLVFLSKYMTLDIIWNSIPLFNSDGYKLLLTLFSVNEKKQVKCNSIFVILFKIMNIVLATVYTYWFVKELFH